MKLKTVWHYAEDDPKCFWDYLCIKLYHSNGNLIKIFGSYRGATKLEAFIEGIEYVLGESVSLEKEEVADGVYY